jgi:hypothetical protein
MVEGWDMFLGSRVHEYIFVIPAQAGTWTTSLD